MKIVYVIDSLASKGGAERIIINKMEYLATRFGYDVSIIACYQDDETPNAYPVPEQVCQYKLGVPFYSQYQYRYPYRLLVKQRLKRQLRRELTKTVQTLDPDILIGVSYFEADVVTAVPCRAKKLIEVHEPRPFTLSDYGLSRGRLSSLYMKHYRNWYFNKVETQADVVVTLTPGDAKEWRRARKVEIIPNFTVMPVEHVSDGCAKRVVSLCKQAGLILTGAGATYPLGNDPRDRNIRIAPTFPSTQELSQAMEVLCLCIEIASIEKLLND